MKDGLRFVDSDMHIMEPPDLFDRYLDSSFRHRVSVPVGTDGRPHRGPSGLILIDGLPTSDSDLQQYRKRIRRGPTQSTQPLSGSRLRSEEHTSELQSRPHLVCRLLLEKKKQN